MNDNALIASVYVYMMCVKVPWYYAIYCRTHEFLTSTVILSNLVRYIVRSLHMRGQIINPFGQAALN